MPLRDDPPGVSDNPACVTDPVRRAELEAEFQSKLRHVANHYRLGKIAYGERSLGYGILHHQ